MRWLVYDTGPRDEKLIGALGLASPAYALGCRDRHVGWADPASKATKESGLRHIMDLSLSVAMPGYAEMLGGKLLAMLALSQPVQTEFQRRYGTELLAVTATCGTGVHCPVYRRIPLKPGGLYQRIGETAGYSTALFSADTVAAARRLTLGVDHPDDILSFKAKPMVVLRRALKEVGISYRPVLRLGLRKGVYLGSMLSDPAAEMSAPPFPTAPALSVACVVEAWRAMISKHQSRDVQYLGRAGVE